MISSMTHSGLSGYLLRARIDSGTARSDGSIALVFDGNVRVVLHPASRGRIVAEAQLCMLPLSARSADDRLLDALARAGQQSAQDRTRLVLSREEDRLLLQATIDADASSDQFEDGLAAFLDSVTEWRAHFGTL
jgi:hypothetical protein